MSLGTKCDTHRRLVVLEEGLVEQLELVAEVVGLVAQLLGGGGGFIQQLDGLPDLAQLFVHLRRSLVDQSAQTREHR